jgi:hypothetical protein
MSIFRRLIPSAEQPPFTIEVTVSAGDSFTLPLVSFGPTAPNFEVFWGDGTSGSVTSVTDGDRIHTYGSSGTYEIQMQGYLPGWNVNNNSLIRDKITKIVDFGSVGLQRVSFYGCEGLVEIIPSASMIISGGIEGEYSGSGYAGLASVKDFSGFMRGTSLAEIPSGLFDFTQVATNFSDAFSFTPIETVPNGLFDNSTSVTSFASTFNGCTSLLTVPDNLFTNNTDVLTFSGTFRNCVKLKDIPSFATNTSVNVFDNVCNMFTTANSSSYWTLNDDIDGEHDFWNRSPVPSGNDAYRNCTGIATPLSDFNFADIPIAYR